VGSESGVLLPPCTRKSGRRGSEVRRGEKFVRNIKCLSGAPEAFQRSRLLSKTPSNSSTLDSAGLFVLDEMLDVSHPQNGRMSPTMTEHLVRDEEVAP
jgi:hypothetical protein